MRAAILIAVALLPLTALGANTPGALALLVNETNAATIEAAVKEALKSPDRITRTTAARMASVRKLAGVLPALRDALAAEKDVEVAAEMAAAVVMLGENDLSAMLAISDRFEAKLDRTISSRRSDHSMRPRCSRSRSGSSSRERSTDSRSMSSSL